MRAARVAFVIWVAVLAGFWGAVAVTDLSATEALRRLVGVAVDHRYGWLVLLGAYLVRTVLFLPITILTVFSGFALGPVFGPALAVVAAVGSSALSYGLARFVASGGKRPRPDDDSRVALWMRQFRQRAFESVLIARVIGAPGDAVNVAAGAGRVPFVPFVAATALGGSPYLVAFALAGASLDDVFGQDPVGFRPELVVIAVAVGAVGLAAATWARRRRGVRPPDGTDES